MYKYQSSCDTTTRKQTLHWKSFIVAFVVAFFINILISAVTGIEQQKNIIWTVLWIYLSIEAWEFWQWKSLIPYPLYIAACLIFILGISNNGISYLSLSLSNILVLILLNIGGLTTFYLLLRKSKQNCYDYSLCVSAKSSDSPDNDVTVVPVTTNYSKN
ncbi:MAG: hypothetical protein GXP51_12630, partial [Deltaproteobacteria bacterium]|nr:hypothetical protein [Deltaproteobacteria bacterium]